jgi:hypothetical protein
MTTSQVNASVKSGRCSCLMAKYWSAAFRPIGFLVEHNQWRERCHGTQFASPSRNSADRNSALAGINQYADTVDDCCCAHQAEKSFNQ